MPAIVVYKAGVLIANLVNISADLGKDFFAGDLETYLSEYDSVLYSYGTVSANIV